MGTKFANLHILSDQIEESLTAIKSSQTSTYYYVGVSDSWISAFGDSWNWEVIGSVAQRVSAMIACPVFYVGYFDDDVLEMGLFLNGQLITKHISGCAVEEYELELATMNIELLQKVLRTDLDEKEVEEILNDTDLSEMMERLENLLNLPLLMKFDWIADDKELESRFIRL